MHSTLRARILGMEDARFLTWQRQFHHAFFDFFIE
jgi:hypothetical protein